MCNGIMIASMEINNKTFVSRLEDSKWGDDYESS